jgi:CBS domain-containing protein
VVAKGALIDIAVRVHDEACIIGAGGDAGLASSALLCRHKHNIGVLPVVTGTGRAIGDTGSMAAVIAAFGTKFGPKMRILASRLLHDPVAIETEGDLVFILAGHNTVAAADACPGINHHRIGGHLRPPP